MDHLPWHSSRPILEVPYVCAHELQHLSSADFIEQLSRMDWAAPDDLSPGDEGHLTSLAEKSQALLWFGLLSSVLHYYYYPPVDFLHQPQTGMSRIDSTLLTRRLSEALTPYTLEERSCRRSNEIYGFADYESENGDDEYARIELSDYGSLVAAGINTATDAVRRWIIPAVVAAEESDRPCSVWDSASYRVFMSIDILIDTIRDIAAEKSRIIQNHLGDRSYFAFETRGIAQSFISIGRCPSIPKRLELKSKEAYLILSMPSTYHADAHSSCSTECCAIMNVDRSSYAVRHVEGCSDCGDFVEVDHQELVDIIRSNHIPLVSSMIDDHGALTIKLVAGTRHSTYAAISHVWAGGLGNFQRNALPKCQLLQLHQDVENTSRPPPDRSDGFGPVYKATRAMTRRLFPAKSSQQTPKLYWMDTLCIPVNSEEARKVAINSMARIYAGAANVLVLDPELRRETSADLRLGDLERTVACSSWMARSWTLQEGALAAELRLKFADQILPVSAANRSHGLVSRSGILRTWSQEIGSVFHPQRSLPVVLSMRTCVELILKYQFGITQGPLQPILIPTIKQTELDRFVGAWNALASRSTTQSQDIAGILASLLHVSAGEILALEDHQRMKALLRSQVYLPMSLLFLSAGPGGSDWTPNFPECTKSAQKLHSDTPMKVTDFGMVIEAAQKMLLCQCNIPVTGTYFLHETSSNQHFHIQFEEQDINEPDPRDTPHVCILTSYHHFGSMSKGLCLTFVKDTDALHVKIRRPFSWQHLPPDTTFEESHDSYTLDNPIGTDYISVQHPLVIDLGGSLRSSELVCF